MFIKEKYLQKLNNITVINTYFIQGLGKIHSKEAVTYRWRLFLKIREQCGEYKREKGENNENNTLWLQNNL